MLHKTQGIVLNFIRYKETSIITKIYTEAFGVQSYIVNGVRGTRGKPGKKTATKIAFFQPLTLLDLVVYYKKVGQRYAGGLNRISEIKCLEPYQTLPYDFKKSGIGIFMAELLGKVLKEEEENTELFTFLRQSLLLFDHLTSGYENFHLQFMLKLSRYLGFPPGAAREVNEQLTLAYGGNSLQDDEIEALQKLIEADYAEHLKINVNIRRALLENLLLYYQLHIDNLKELKSTQVLRELMD